MTAALVFALKNWKLLIGGFGLLLLSLYIVHLKGEVRHWQKESDRFAGLYHAEQSAHAATVANYRRAADLARAQDAANKARVERDQATISQEVSHDYSQKLADLRARYDAIRLRGKGSASTANPSLGGIAGMPEAGSPTSGPYAAAGEDGLSVDDRFLCSAQAEQLDALISWNLRQEAVQVSLPDESPPG